MANFPDSVSVPVASPSKSRKFYTQQHQTTQGFMKPRPIFCREVIPGRDMSVKTNSYVRANPMPVPILGTCNIHNRAFFVPFRCVFPMWNHFIENTYYAYNNQSIMPEVPVISNDDIVSYFETPGFNLLSPVTSWGAADIAINTNGTPTYYTFTEEGLETFSLLTSLGIKVNWNHDDVYQHPALKLLAFCKVMIDWYYPSAYVGSSDYSTVQGLCNWYSSSQLILSQSNLRSLMKVCITCSYNNDFYTNVWDNPIGPNGGVERSMIIKDVTNPTNYPFQVRNNSVNGGSPHQNSMKPNNGTPFIEGANQYSSAAYSAQGVTTQYITQALRAMTDFTLRHRIAGVRALDRYLAEYGINLSSEIMSRSMYLGAQKFDMEFYDVFSHADTASSSGGARLGDYAGKGNGFSGDYTFELKNSQEFGVLIIVNSIVPNVGYYQGQHLEDMHRNVLDFYHGTYDHMIVQPVASRNVYVPLDGSLAVAQANSSASINDNIFGYTSKYIEYNTPIDCQSGLFLSRQESGLLPFYSLMRNLDWMDSLTLATAKHSIGFVQGSDRAQYNRIFYNLGAGNLGFDQDNFICAHRFEVTNVDSTLQPYESYEFEHDDKNQEVDMQVNGSKLN